jgi:Uma2 family endonuclease
MTEKISPMLRSLKIKKRYNIKEFFEFVKRKRDRGGTRQYELIRGKIYMMASPTVIHQDVVSFINTELRHYLKGKTCRAFIAPLDVVLFEKDNEKENKDDSQNVFQPDVFIVCDPKKISDKRINGAPDVVFEVVSDGTASRDYGYKFNKYIEHGVREYWIVNPETKRIFVKKKKKKAKTYTYTFEDKIKVSIFEDFEIDFKELNL